MQAVVQAAIQGATVSGSTNASAVAALVYGAETVARNTTGASAALVSTAVDALTVAANPNLSVLHCRSGCSGRGRLRRQPAVRFKPPVTAN